MHTINEPVLNIIVIGFHHKKGCQVEYCYPELVPGSPTELPAAWKHLPALALPDGSHNHLSDTIFFHLPGLNEPEYTVYAISCFRQIPIEQVVQKTEDMTRSSVQKSVCIICRAPLFGRLAVKMELVVREWFLQGDFSQMQLLEDAYRNLNSCPAQMEQTLEGLSVQKVMETWRHKALLLFKLLLLRRKVLVYGSTAGPLSAALLALVSLLPRCIEQGLHQAANIQLTEHMSLIEKDACETAEMATEQNFIQYNDTELLAVDILSSKETGNHLEDKDNVSRQSDEDALSSDVLDKTESVHREKANSVSEKSRSKSIADSQQSPTMARDMSIDALSSLTGRIDRGECGFPLHIFESGYLCLPYLSLQYLDLLAEGAVEGFVVGASNVLFKQKRQLFEVVVEVGDMRIETVDAALRRQLALGTEDLRFADHVLRHAAAQGDRWIRDQFASYLIYLLRTSLLPEGCREIEPFNAQFMSAFKSTPIYLQWLKDTNGGQIEAFLNLMPAHPFAGQLSVADMKLRLAHTMSTTEGGRKVTAAVASTGRAVATTSRAVGGALSQARGALTGWWSSLTAPPAGPAPLDHINEGSHHSDAEDAAEAQPPQPASASNQISTDLPDTTLADNITNLGKIRVV